MKNTYTLLINYIFVLVTFFAFLQLGSCQLDDDFNHTFEPDTLDTLDTIIIPTDSCNNPIYFGTKTNGFFYYQNIQPIGVSTGSFVSSSPDGQYLVTDALQFGLWYGIKKLNIATGELTQLTNFGFNPDWCENDWIVFGYSGNLYKVKADGSEVEMVYSDGVSDYPYWNNTCEEIAFGGGGYGGIIDEEANLLYSLEDSIDFYFGNVSDWHPEKSLFVSTVTSGSSGLDTNYLYVFNTLTNELTHSIPTEVLRANPKISPCGRYVLTSKWTSLDLYDLTTNNWIELMPQSLNLGDTATSKVYNSNWINENTIVYFHFREDTFYQPAQGGNYFNGGEYTFRIANIDSLLGNCY